MIYIGIWWGVICQYCFMFCKFGKCKFCVFSLIRTTVLKLAFSHKFFFAIMFQILKASMCHLDYVYHWQENNLYWRNLFKKICFDFGIVPYMFNYSLGFTLWCLLILFQPAEEHVYPKRMFYIFTFFEQSGPFLHYS